MSGFGGRDGTKGPTATAVVGTEQKEYLDDDSILKRGSCESQWGEKLLSKNIAENLTQKNRTKLSEKKDGFEGGKTRVEKIVNIFAK